MGLVDGDDLLDGFEFDDDGVVCEEVDPVSGIDCDSILVDWLCLLSFHYEASLGQFMRQAGFVCAFEKPRSQRLMNFERCIHNH